LRNKIKLNKVSVVSLTIFLVSLIASLFIQFYAFDKKAIGHDQTLHFYDMKVHYESDKLPTTGSRFIATAVTKAEFTTPRVPGGVYYIFYTLFYKLANESLDGARLINLIFSFSIILIFLFWCYKKFNIFITSIISAFILCNGYVINSVINFWNPNITLLFSFIFFILLYEYIAEDKHSITVISSIFIFPTLAIMAQAHFTVFFSMVPTIIVYLIIKYKKTKIYILYWSLGVFISFLLYLPYLILEIQNDFINLNLALNVRERLATFPIPQLYALLIFPTNEISVLLGTRFNSAKYFWTTGTPYFYGLIFLFLSMMFSFYTFVNALILLIKKNYNSKIKTEKICKELMFILMLFIPATMISFFIFKSKSGTFHYLYSAFALSFSPIILFFIQKENSIKIYDKKLYILTILLILNIASMTGQLTRHYRLFEEPRNYRNIEKVAEFIKKDAKTSSIKIYNNFGGNMPYQYEDIFNTYFPHFNIKTSENPDIMYSIVDNIMYINWSKDRNKREMAYLFTNNALILTNIGGYTIYKFSYIPK